MRCDYWFRAFDWSPMSTEQRLAEQRRALEAEVRSARHSLAMAEAALERFNERHPVPVDSN